MRVTVFGATGSIGQHVVQQALAAGYQVHVVVRDPSKLGDVAVTTTVGQLTDAAVVDRAVENSDAVIWAVGATQNQADQVEIFEAGARNLVTAMQQHGIRRLVALSGAGITVDGERKPLRARILSAVIARIVRHVVEAKRREYEVFRASGLDWTMVRPPRVVPGPPTGQMTAGSHLAGSGATAGDVGQFLVQQLTDTSYIHAAPYVSGPA